MGSLKKFDGSSWINSNLRKLTTDTDTFTTFPAIIYAEGTNATVGLKGNTVQPGTPTSDNPIMPEGTGDKTANLLNADTYYSDYKSGSSYTATVSQFNDTIIRPFAMSDIGKTYTISCDITEISSTNVRWIATINGVSVNGDGRSNTGQIKLTFTVETENDSLRITYGSGNYTLTIAKVMMNEGSTPLPYEPYGYKIPISSAGTTTPIYLGEVETTRKVKKYIFTGAEDWKARTSPDNSYSINYSVINMGDGVVYHGVCSHFVNPHSAVSNIISGQCYFGTSAVSFRLDDTTDLTQWTNWLQQQYAAGTPVTVWYVLAEPETAVVNEPLMRIGDYTDTLSSISIPVTAGENTISIGTTVQPSEVTANYYGWHTITVHERESGQWD